MAGVCTGFWQVGADQQVFFDFGVAATLFNPDYAATLVTSMLRL